MGITITIVLIILLIILVISLFAAIFELMEKVEKFAKSNQEHISSFKRYEKDIKILEDNSNYKIKENRENLKNEIEEILNEFNYSYANYKVNVLGYSDYVGVFPANDDTYELWRRLGFVDINRR